jgi:hypothetical protein
MMKDYTIHTLLIKRIKRIRKLNKLIINIISGSNYSN